MREPERQEAVVDVLPVGEKERRPAQGAVRHGEQRASDGEAERDDRDDDRDGRLRPDEPMRFSGGAGHDVPRNDHRLFARSRTEGSSLGPWPATRRSKSAMKPALRRGAPRTSATSTSQERASAARS